MKYILEFLLGMVFLFSMISCVYAQQFDWNTYGGQFDPSIKNAQSTFGVGRLDLNINSVLSSYGSTYSSTLNVQPIVANLGNPSREYIIFPNNNSIQVIDSNMNLITSLNVSNPALSQISAVDFDSDGNIDDIAVLTNSSSTNFIFRVFSFNISSLSFNSNPIYNVNFTFEAGSSSSGIRCINQDCYLIVSRPSGVLFNVTFLDLNYNTYTMVNLTTQITNKSIEPPALSDYDGDGVVEYMTWSADKILIFDNSGFVLTELNVSKVGVGVYATGVFESVKMIKSDNSPIWKIALNKRYTGLISGCFDDEELFLMGQNSSGSLLYQKNLDCASNSADIIHSGGIAIADYDLDGFDDIFTASYRGNNNNATKIYVFIGNTGSLVSSFNTTTSTMRNTPITSMTLAKLNGDNYYDFILSTGNIFSIYDPILNTFIYYTNTQNNMTGCVPSDLNYDGFQEVVCSGNGASRYYYSGALLLCNQNTICESQFNENYTNCPTDCVSPFSNVTTAIPDTQQATETGGMPIPSKIVDTTNYEKGLLPEVYYGTLGFLSNTLQPAIIIIFVIFFVLIILAFGFIIKRIAHKIGQLSH